MIPSTNNDVQKQIQCNSQVQNLNNLISKTQTQYENDNKMRTHLYPNTNICFQVKELEQKIRFEISKLLNNKEKKQNNKQKLDKLSIEAKQVEDQIKNEQQKKQHLLKDYNVQMRKFINASQKIQNNQYFIRFVQNYPVQVYDPNNTPPQLVNLCTSCFQEIQPMASYRLTACKHLFHLHCFYNVFLQGRCPACNKLVRTHSRYVSDQTINNILPNDYLQNQDSISYSGSQQQKQAQQQSNEMNSNTQIILSKQQLIEKQKDKKQQQLQSQKQQQQKEDQIQEKQVLKVEQQKAEQQQIQQQKGNIDK